MEEQQDILDEQEQQPLETDGQPKPKPKFNPNQSFTPVAEVKPPFNPNAPAEPVKKKDGSVGAEIGGTVGGNFSSVSFDPLRNHGLLSLTTQTKNTQGDSDTPVTNLKKLKEDAKQSKVLILGNGIPLEVQYPYGDMPFQNIEAVKKIQQKIDLGVGLSIFDKDEIAKITGKPLQAIDAYISGDQPKAKAYETEDIVKKNKAELTEIVNQYNTDFGGNKKPEEVLSSADQTAKFMDEYLSNLVKSDPIKAKIAQMDAEGRDIDTQILATLVQNDEELKNKLQKYNSLLQSSGKVVSELSNHIVKTTAYEDYVNAVPRETTANKIAQRLDPIGYRNAQKALKIQSGFDSLTDHSNVFDVISALTDEISGSGKFKDQMLNSIVGHADLQLNNSYAQIANEKAALAQLNGDESLLTEAKLIYSNIDKDIIKKYPAIHMQQMATELANDIAKEAGQLVGTETEDYNLKVSGLYGQQDYLLKLITEKGWLEDPDKKQLAIRLLENPELIKDASYLGGVKSSFLQPFKDLGLSIMDLTGTRNFKDIYSDKVKDELFPKEFNPDETKTSFTLLGHDFKARNIANGISNLAGLVVGNIITEGALSNTGLSANAIKRISAYTTFGIPSIDANLKDSYNFIDNDAERAAFVTLGALINGEGGALLDLGKVSRIPGLANDFKKLSKNLVEKNLTTSAVEEVLNRSKNKYVDFVVKYGKYPAGVTKETIKGAATMAYFTFGNEYNKLLNGDPNTQGEDLLPHAANAFMEGIFTMIPFGFVSGIKAGNPNQNSSYKEMINKIATFPDAAQDAFRLGSKSQQDFNYKMQVLNTARGAKNALEIAEQDTGIRLDQGQRSAYIANKTIEASLRDKAEKTTNTTLKEQYLKDADELAEQSIKTMDGLKFSPTLEPLYDLYDAEKKYNKAYEDFHSGDVKDDAALIEARNKYENLTYKYFTENKSPAPEQIIVNGAYFTKGNLLDILSKGQKEADKYDIEYIGSDADLHEKLQAFGAVTEDNYSISPKSREVLNTEGAADLFERLEGKLDTRFLDPVDKEGSIVQLQNQALTAPGAIHSELGYNEKLTLELIARNTTEDINKSIDKWSESVKGENVSPSQTKDADRHIRLLEKALEYKAKVHNESVIKFPEIENKEAKGLFEKIKGKDESLDNFRHIDSVVDRVTKSEPINEKELNDAQDVLYETLDKNPEASHLIEPLISKLQDYEHTTITENRTVTEKEPIEITGKAGDRLPVKKSIDQWEGNRATVRDKNGKESTGIIKIEDGKYYLYNEAGEKVAALGDKTITDRDISLPSPEDVPMPIKIDKDGNVESITLQLNKVDKENPGIEKDKLITVNFRDKEKALDYAIQLRAEQVGEVPKTFFEQQFKEVKKEIQVEVEKPKVVGEHDGVKILSTSSGQKFHDAINKAMSLRKEDRFQADVHPVEFYQEVVDTGGKLFLSEDGKFGAYVRADGYMGSLFKSPDADSKGVAKALQDIRVNAGGRFFDAYGTHLEDIYIQNGFSPVARLKFNEEYAPEGWQDSNLKDKPDVVFFAYDPKGEAKKGDGKYFEDYEKAYIFAEEYKNNESRAEDISSAAGNEELITSSDVSKEGISPDGTNNTGYNEGQEGDKGSSPVNPEPAHINNSLTTQEFFSNTVNGANQPKIPWKPLLAMEGALKKVYDVWQKFRGGFDAHIETNIPAFRDVQIKKINAIAETLPDGGLVIDLGGSEGGFGKTLTAINPKIKTVNLDMNPDMEAAHNRNPVEGAEFVKAAFGEDVPLDDGTVVNRHQPPEKADVVHESMMFQFIMPERKSFIDEIADHYVKEDGVVILEEKVKAENWSANETKKDNDFKSDYYDSAAVKKKNEEVVVGMKGNQAEEVDLINDLTSRFDYVYQYWDSGNFKGYIASNNAAKAKAMLEAIGDTKTDYTSREKLLSVEQGVISNQPDYLGTGTSASAPAAPGQPSVKELDSLANNIPDSGRITEYMSKDTIEKYTGETPTNNQARGVQELEIALVHGEKIIDTAKNIFGKDYVDKTLDYIEKSTAGVSNKALMYVSLENALGKEKLANPTRKVDLTKQQALVYEKSQAFARENSLALNYQKLRKAAQVGYDLTKITDNFFSPEELIAKNEVSKAIEADADTINKEAEAKEVQAMEAATITPDVEKLIQEGVEKEIAKINEKLPPSLRRKANESIAALEKIQTRLRTKTYDASIGIPVAIVDAGITAIKLALKAGIKIADAIEIGINKIKELHGKPWEKEDEFRKDWLSGFKDENGLNVKEFTKDALIAQGFGREITVKGEKREILDWKKLAGAAGSVSKISENVAEMLEGSKFSEKEIEAVKKDFIDEYIEIRTSVIEKSQNELARRNKETVSPDQKSAAKKLAELYTYGLFEDKPVEFEHALNKALGVKVSEKGYDDARKIAEAMETIYSSSFKGITLDDVSAKVAIHKLEDQLRILLFNESKRQGNNFLRLANIVRGYFDFQQTMILNNMKQAFENPLSGLEQNVIDKISGITSKEGIGTGAMADQRRKLMKDVYSDITLHGGIGYGKVESSFVNRTHIDDYINKLSDSQLYHGIASVVTGRATLNSMDAMYKAGITEKKFANNLIKILTNETNPNRMGKDDAIKFVSETLTGQTFKDAQVTAKEIIEKINKDAGTKLLPDNKEAVDRFANDIVKSALEMGDKITADQITAAYNAAYKSAGLGLGHEPNNFISSQVMAYTQKIEDKINVAIKNKEWNRAAMLTGASITFRNLLNPFVGGGTNWLVLKVEKTGLGLFTGLGYQIASKTRLDLSTDIGVKKMEERLYNQARVKDNYMRGLIGGIASATTYLAFTGLANTDDYRKWRNKNAWAARYLDVVTPEYLLAEMAVKNKKIKKYAASSFNKNDAFDAQTKIIKAADFAIAGKEKEAWGALGEAVGSKINAPVPWRLVKDGQVIYQGIIGQDPYHGDYKPSKGFINGVFQGGAIEWLGFRPGKK